MLRAIYIAFLFLCLTGGAQDDFHVKENDGSLDLKTPYGDKEIPDVNPDDGMSSYKIVIPLKDLKPPPPPPKPPEEKAPDAKDADDGDDDEEEAPVKPEEKAKAPADATVPPMAPVPAKPSAPDYDDSDEMILEANWLYNHRRYFEASTMVKRILTKQPNLVRAWVMKGSLLYVQGEKDLARKAWEHAETLDPNNAEVKQLLEKFK